MKKIAVLVVAGVILALLAAAGSAIRAAATDGTLIRVLGGVPSSPNRDEVRRSYGDGAHSGTTLRVDCPTGTYVGGIAVAYGGTCLNQCDGDGGIIRNIELVCKPL